MVSTIAKGLLSHISSATVTLFLCGLYISKETEWLAAFLPANGQPLAIFTLLSVLFLHEMSIKVQMRSDLQYKSLLDKQSSLARQIEVNRLIQAVNGLYGRVIASSEQCITNEYTIKELAELNDTRVRLNVNSYTQGKLEYLTGLVKR